MLVMTKKNTTNLSKFVDYQNAGPTMKFLGVSRAIVIDVCDVRVCYRLVAVKAMHTTSTQNILLENLLSHV